MNVVLIDDEYMGLDLLERILIVINPNIKISGKFRSPIEAIPHLLEKNPDIIIMDLETPQISGLEMAKLFSFSHSHFIIISTLDARQLLKEHKNQKTIFLDKPFTTNDMYKALSTIEKRTSITEKT